MAQMNPVDQAKMQMMQDLEIEMMSDLYTRMTTACHKKCVPPRYSEPDLGRFWFEWSESACFSHCSTYEILFFFAGKGEAVCLDRCVAKYLDIHERIGKKLTAMSMQDEALLKNMSG